jgi:hypothetical protein
MVMMDLSDHGSHGGLDVLQSTGSEANAKNAIRHDWIYASCPKSHSGMNVKTPPCSEPFLQAVKGSVGKSSSVLDRGIFKLGITDQRAKIFGLLHNRENKGLRSALDFDPFTRISAKGQGLTHRPEIGASHGEKYG